MITREEALLLLSKLCEAPRVKCAVSTPSFRLWADGKLFRRGDHFVLGSSDFSFEFGLDGDFGFEYSEPKNGEEAWLMSGLGIALPLRQTITARGELSGASRDKIVLMEMKSRA